jgi:hypothetical protein
MDPMRNEYHEVMQALRFQDPMKEMREAMQALRVQDPMKEMREAMQALRIQDSMKEMREAMQSLRVRDSMKEMREVMQALRVQDPMKEMRETMQSLRFQDPMKEMREAMQALRVQDSMKEMREVMQTLRVQDPMKEIREAMQALRVQAPLREMLEAMQSKDVRNLVDTISPLVRSSAYEDLPADIVIRDDNAIAIGATTLTQFDVQNLINQIADKAFSQSAGKIELAVKEIIAEIASLRNPLLEKVLTWLIFPIIIATIFSIINPVADYYIKESLTSNDRQTKKNIRKHVLSSVVDSAQLDSYRFVSSKALDVHLNPAAKSPVLGCFHFGQAVLLIRKDKDWSLVAWSDKVGYFLDT